MGNTHGEVNSGPFAGWKSDKGEALRRNLNASEGYPLREDNITAYMDFTDIDHALGLGFYQPVCFWSFSSTVNSFYNGMQGTGKVFHYREHSAKWGVKTQILCLLGQNLISLLRAFHY